MSSGCLSSKAPQPRVGSTVLGCLGKGDRAVRVLGEGLSCELCPPRAKNSHEMSKITH